MKAEETGFFKKTRFLALSYKYSCFLFIYSVNSFNIASVMSRLFTIIKYLFLLIPVFAAIAVFIISNGNLSVTALVFVISGGFEGLYYMATRNLEEQARKNFNESVDENYVKLKKDNSVF